MYIQSGKRPKLTNELEALESLNQPAMSQPDTELEEKEGELEALRFLIDLFRQCTKENPIDRPMAEDLHEMLLSHTSKFTSSRS